MPRQGERKHCLYFNNCSLLFADCSCAYHKFGCLFFQKKNVIIFLVQSQGILLNVEFLGRSASMKSSAIESFLEKDCLRS